MARARSKATTSAKRRSQQAARPTTSAATRKKAADRFVCPDCGATFDRPQSLGAHRRQAHGVVGTSKRSLSRHGAAGSAAVGTKPRSRRGTAASKARSQAQSTSRSDGNRGVDRNRLLQALFPDGIPAREEVIRELNAWLEQAERLARLR